jgi:hypothetical protein
LEPGKERSSSAQKTSALAGLLGILSLVSLSWLFSRLRAPNQNAIGSVPLKDTPDKESQQGQFGKGIVSNSPPTPTYQANASRSKDGTPPAWKKAAEISVAIGTLGLLLVNILLWCSTKKTADAAKNSADTSAKELELSQRPWVSLSNISVDSPLIFDSNGAHVKIGFSITNTGRSVATNGFYSVEFMATMADLPSPVQERDKLCKFQGERSQRVKETNMSRFAQVWFPGQPIQMSHILSVDRGQIRTAMVDIPKKMFPERPPPNFFMPVLVGCVVYRPSFIEAQYHTGYILELVHKKTLKAPIFMQHGEVPASELEFRYHPFYGVYAD